jgi:hypothetical protein
MGPADLAENLDDFLEDANAPSEPSRFTITDDDKADWAVKKVIRHQREIDAAKKLAEQRIAQINAWLQSIIEGHEKEIGFFEMLLHPFVEARLAGTKKKTLSLPSGDVQLRSAAPTFMIAGEKVCADTPALVDHVRRFAPDYLKIKESVDWGELKKTLNVTSIGQVVSGDGEILDFITAYQPPDAVKVKEGK